MNRDNMNRGRPIGKTKDPNRRRVRNDNGRLIDYGGLQYNRLIQSGYMLNTEGDRLVAERNFTANRITHRPVGRPSGPTRVVPNMLVRAPQATGGVVDLLSSPVPDIQVPVLSPTKYKPSSKIHDSQSDIKTSIAATIKATADWILNIVPEKIIKPVSKKLKALKDQVASIFSKFKESKYNVRKTKSALKGFTTLYTIDGKDGIDAMSFLSSAQPHVLKILTYNLQSKVNIMLTCEMEKVDIKSGEITSSNGHFQSYNEIILPSTDVAKVFQKAKGKMLESMATFQMRGSNWRFRRVLKLEINIVEYKPLKGSSYIPLPDNLAAKKAIINMKNEDHHCFKWCIARAMNPVAKNSERISKLLIKQSEEFNWSGIEFPVSLKDINKFEKNNNMSINVFGYEKEIIPLRISTVVSKYEIDLLLISKGDIYHYCLIKNFNKLMARNHHAMHYCRRCLNGFTCKEALTKHREYCMQHDIQKIVMPDPDTMLKFKNDSRSMRLPFIVYADFESLIKPIDTCQPNPSDSYTNQYQKHTPSSFCYYIKSFDDNIFTQPPVSFTAKSPDDDVAQIFFNTLEKNIIDIYNKFKFSKQMIFTESDKQTFDEATVCHICDKELGSDRVRDHCHLSGKFRGAAHNECNLNFKIPKFFPVVFHNLSGYDSHLFVKKLAGGNINCIPCNEEKYISFSREVIVDKFVNKEGKSVQVKRELRFIDSFRFMPSSLDTLSKNLSKEQCKNINNKYSGKKLDLLLRKGVYPYDHVSSLERLDETNLPPKEAFYSKLNAAGISDKDYEHAQTVWNEFDCKSFRDYHDLYNVSDVLLLADVFENFRDVCMVNYKLDPAWYYTAPGLAWDAALKLTKVELGLLSDYDMLLMIKHGIRGGVSTISNRYAKANNKYMGDKFNSIEPSKFITYLDANNLYGYGMSKPLPTHGFQWMTKEELDIWKKISGMKGHGCILEVDLEYPTSLHDLHNDYPLAPDTMKLEVNKLVPNLYNKTKYILHYENLNLYKSLGMKITKIHRGIKFVESPWLQPYIDFNTKLRTKAANDFEKDFFKLMNNSVFGKTMENIENRINFRLVCDRKKAVELAAKPYYDRTTIFSEDIVGIHMKKTKLKYDKPIYLGMSILDLSKTLMYDFHYNYIKHKYNDKAMLLFTDTDSLMYEIQTDDFYADISNDLDLKFDTSDYPENHPSGIKTGINKKVIGMFKDEACGKQIEEFVGLRAKLYSYKMENTVSKKCKGVKKNVVDQTISHDDYKDCLFSRNIQLRKMNVFRSRLHDVYTEEINKIALSSDDDKRVIMDDGVRTQAYGHFSLRAAT